MFQKPFMAAGVIMFALLMACGGDKGESTNEENETGAAAETGASATSGAQPSTAPTGKTIEIRMITDDKGNYYQPSTIEAKPGDVLHFVLVSGVHNVNFLADSNQGKAGLPSVSEMQQLPGQTLDIPMNFAPGSYYFQCDPHAALGMVGRLEVENAKDES